MPIMPDLPRITFITFQQSIIPKKIIKTIQ